MEIELKATVVFEKNWEAINSDRRYIRNEGGSRSSKTFSLCQVFILYCMKNPNTTISIVRKTFPALRASVMRDFFEIIKEMNLYKASNHNKSENLYNFDNGSVIEFFSADDEQKLRGRKRDICFINEANELLYEDFQQIAMRTTQKIIIDYNPSSNSSWIYELPEDKTVYIHSTYKDNPFLTNAIVEQIESYKETDINYYTIFALGKRANSKENVYGEWEVRKEKPEYLNDYLYGLDFGFTHPTALVKIWYSADEKINELYLEEIIYEGGLTSTDLIDLMELKGVDKVKAIVADYARPEIIYDIKKRGFKCIDAIKDVKDGINNVKTFKVIVNDFATNIIKENQLYKYKKINGMVVDDVVKLNDDMMDAIRYGVFYLKKYLKKSSSAGGGIYKFNF